MGASTLPQDANEYQSARIGRIHVLILVSSDRAADLVKRLFLNLGFANLYIAQDAVGGVQYLKDLRIHLIVTDADLKIVSNPRDEDKKPPTKFDRMQFAGIEFVHRLRTASASPAPFIPILMLMDHAATDAVVKARDAGVNEIILKPLEAKNFCERIINLVDKPRVYITATSYRGPCRRHRKGAAPSEAERRTREVRLIRCDESQGMCA